MSSTEHWWPAGSEAQGRSPAHTPLPGSWRLLETRYHQKEAPAHEGHAPQPRPGGATRPVRAHRPVHWSRWNRLSSLCVSRGALCQQLGSQQVLWLNPNMHRAVPQTFPRGRLLAEIKSGHFLEGNRPYRSPDIQAHCYEKQNFQSKKRMWKSSLGHPVSPQLDLVLRHSQNALKEKNLATFRTELTVATSLPLAHFIASFLSLLGA